MRKKILKTLSYMLCGLLSCTAFTACDRDVHDDEYPDAERCGNNALVVGLQSETRPEHLSLYIFDSKGEIALYRGYTDPRVPASAYFPLEAGSYTVMVVAGVPEGELPKPPGELTPSSLAGWIDENRDAYPGMLTASRQAEVRGITRVLLVLGKGGGETAFTRVRLLLSVPGREMPDYTPTRAADAGDAWRLRCKAEVCRRGTENRVYSRASLCTPQADGRYAVEMPLQPGEYDIRLWADWTDDGTTGGKYYDTDDLHDVAVRTDGYTAGFDAVTGKPNDARNGIAYTTRPVAADGFDAGKARQVGADFVLANGGDSFITVTVRIEDRTTGRTVSAVQDVKIPYRRGCLTTVTWRFLTAGAASGGVTIDPDWEEIIVPF